MRKPSPSVVVLAVLAGLFVWSQVTAATRQAGTEKSVAANCEVVAVLLSTRADRDEAVKLFEPIRRQNPEQFDKLVKRAEDGDKRLAAVQGDLACRVLPVSDTDAPAGQGTRRPGNAPAPGGDRPT